MEFFHPQQRKLQSWAPASQRILLNSTEATQTRTITVESFSNRKPQTAQTKVVVNLIPNKWRGGHNFQTKLFVRNLMSKMYIFNSILINHDDQ